MALPSCPFQIYNPRTAARPELTNTIVLQTQLTKLEIKQLQVEKVSNSRIASSTLASGEVNSGTVSHARPATLILDKAKGCIVAYTLSFYSYNTSSYSIEEQGIVCAEPRTVALLGEVGSHKLRRKMKT